MKRYGKALLIVSIIAGCAMGKTSGRTTSERLSYQLQSAFQKRGINPEYNSYRKYVAGLFEARKNEVLPEKTGKCRLSWIERLVEDPIHAAQEADQFTSMLQSNRREEYFRILSNKLDVTFPQQNQNNASVSGNSIIDIQHTIKTARQALHQAFRDLQEPERNQLRAQLVNQFAEGIDPVFHLKDKTQASSIVSLIEKIDRSQLIFGGDLLVKLSRTSRLTDMANSKTFRTIEPPPGVKGSILQKIDSADGIIIIGGPGRNEYHLDEASGVVAVIDPDGNDVYLEGAITEERPILLIMDLKGDDVYQGRQPGIQGGAILGFSMLLDRSGNDRYEAEMVAQGSALAGIGLLVDESGNDIYRGDRRVQGHGLGGIGLLIDTAGSDQYRAAMIAQGTGGPFGIGMLQDQSGNDSYFAGGQYPDPYDDSPGFGGWSQGVGIGIRGVAEGGIGILLEGAGDDVYEADYFSHGGGYWFAAGFARDFNGNDQRLGATRKNFDGSPRTEPRYLRWGQSFGCHYAAGFLFDDNGNDTYHGEMAVIAFAWDVSFAALLDSNGTDRYLSTGSGVAQSRNVAFAVLYDRSGTDDYRGNGLGTAELVSKTHKVERHSFALLLDESRTDSYPVGLKNRTDNERGWAGGFFLDR